MAAVYHKAGLFAHTVKCAILSHRVEHICRPNQPDLISTPALDSLHAGPESTNSP